MAACARSNVYQLALETKADIEAKLPAELRRPEIGIICGSGLGGLADLVSSDSKTEISYTDLKNFPKSTVPGHAGKLVFAYLGSQRKPAVLMVGRVHFYEGYSIEEITFPVRVMKLLGVQVLVVTNAAGGLNSEYAVGDIVLLHDHLNFLGLAGMNPLRGPNTEEFGVRFPAMSDAYDLKLRKAAYAAWKKTASSQTRGRRRLHEGVYAVVGGPNYETRAESRMLQMFGVDVVGMSTVPEVLVARHCGMRVLAMSLVTNMVVLDRAPRGDDPNVVEASDEELKTLISKGRANHAEVIEAGREAAADFQVLVQQLIEEI